MRSVLLCHKNELKRHQEVININELLGLFRVDMGLCFRLTFCQAFFLVSLLMTYRLLVT